MINRIAFPAAVLGVLALVNGVGLAVATAGSPVTETAIVHAAPVATWPGHTSGNWSGYGGAVSSGKLTEASATWKVPKVQAIKGFSSTWVGIDGLTNSDLIQTGTEQDYTGSTFIYRAWWEILPASETIIPSLTIHPGDTMTGTVKDTSGDNWVITLKDVTSGKSFTIKKHYTGPGASAEWIQEAPTSGGIETLAHYSTTEFSKLTLAANFKAPQNAGIEYPNQAIAMVQNGQIVSIPSKVAGGNSFNVAYGNVQPKAP